MSTTIKLISAILNKYTLAITVLFMICLLGVLSFQGFDVCDEGWYMTFYQQLFNAPETVEYNFAFWLTGIVGAIWHEMFPDGGILSFRILTLVVIVLTFIVAYKILVRYIKKQYVVFGLLMVMLVNDFGYLAFYYNHLSGFLSVCIIFFLDRGLRKKRLLELCIAGFLTAINVFSRLPNVTLFALILIFPAQYFFQKETNVKYVLKQVLVFLLGSVIGLFITYLVMLNLGHISVFKNALMGLFDKGSNADSNHNIKKLLEVYIREYIKILKFGFWVTSISFTVLVTSQWVKKKPLLKSVKYIVGIFFFVFLFRKEAIYGLYFLGIIGTLYFILVKTVDRNIKNLAFLILVVAILLPMGSDGGIHNAGYVCIWLFVPMFLFFLSEVETIKIKWKLKSITNKIIIDRCDFKTLITVLVVSFFIVKTYKISKEAYFDEGSRFKKTYVINNDLAKGIYTTKERTEIINPVLEALEPYVKENDYLLAYDNIPMINFLTKTKPYMGISWVWVYDSETFDKKIRQAEKNIKNRPIVVQQKFRTIVYFSEPDEDYMSETKQENYIYKSGRVIAMNKFLKRNNYEVVWSNSHFNILKPSSQTLAEN